MNIIQKKEYLTTKDVATILGSGNTCWVYEYYEKLEDGYFPNLTLTFYYLPDYDFKKRKDGIFIKEDGLEVIREMREFFSEHRRAEKGTKSNIVVKEIKGFISLAKASTQLKITVKTLRNRIEKNDVNVYKFGNKITVKIEDLNKLK